MTLQELITSANATQLNTILPENQVIWIRDRLKELEDQLKVTAPTDDEKTCLVQIYRSYGEVCAQNKETHLTIKCQEKVHALAPNGDEIAIYSYSRATDENYKYEREIIDLTKAHELTPNDNVTTTYLAMAYFLSGLSKIKAADYAGAINDLTNAHTLTPNEDKITTMLAMAYDVSGALKLQAADYAGAISDLEMGRALDPNNDSITTNLAMAYNISGLSKAQGANYAGAISDLANAHMLTPNDGEITADLVGLVGPIIVESNEG